jgi:hypothetical protein
MLDLDGNIGRGDTLWCALENGPDVMADAVPKVIGILGNVDVSGEGEVRLELRLVDLSNRPNTDRLLVELVEYVIKITPAEGLPDYPLSRMERVGRGVGMKL